MPDNFLVDDGAAFVDIYQIEKADVWVGGPGGKANKQGQSLANRTRFLKLLIDAHAAAVDPHPQYMTTAESDAAIAAAVAQLVNSSPTALDTLAELATALGNDANFATTVTNALAAKAPWAVVEQIITAAGLVIDHNTPGQLLTALRAAGVFQTPAQFDSSTKAATTEFVIKVGLSAAELLTITANATLTAAAHAGRSILVGSGIGNISLNLPLANTVRAGSRIEFMHTGNSAYSTSLVRQGADIITNPGAKTSVSLQFGETIVLESDGISQWFAVGGSLAASIGSGQTWQDMTASRTVGTNYTNTTGRTIVVAAYLTVSSGTPSVNIRVNGIYVGGQTCSVVGGAISVQAIVPPGATYLVSTVAGASLSYWSELR